MDADAGVSAETAAFLGQVMPAIVGTRLDNGTVTMNPAWYEYDGGYFWLNSWRGARWLARVERNRQASLLMIDPNDMYRVVRAQTRLVRTTTDGAVEHVNRLSQRYRGRPYRSAAPQQRVLIQLEPVRVRSQLGWRARAVR
jgi:hypothetical protein